MRSALTRTLSVARYEPRDREQWNTFVASAKNGVFLFHRDYMDYHTDRFVDGSLIFVRDGRPLALLPANRSDDVLVSHGGLTFGGIVSGNEMRTPLMLELFETLRSRLREDGITRLVYKAVPHIYHRQPAEEDLYALIRNGARLVRRDVTSTIRLADRGRISDRRRRGASRARAAGLEVRRSDDFDAFMAIMGDLLREKYDRDPVHTPEELRLLASRFPGHIELQAAFDGETMLGGVVVYADHRVAHAQYTGATEEGKRLGALDLVFEQLLERYTDRAYFDFGISSDRDGSFLNVPLIENKEGFGARAVVHDFYELDIAR